MWRTFLGEQRARVRELDAAAAAVSAVRAPVLLLAEPNDALIPFHTARQLAQALPDARLQQVRGPVITCPGEPRVPWPRR